MSPFGIASSLFSLVKSIGSDSSPQSSPKASGHIVVQGKEDFSSSLALQVAGLQAQSVNTLLGSVFSGNKGTSNIDFLGQLTGAQGSSNDPLSLLGLSNGTTGLSTNGRNRSLFDPESAYRMMSVINTDDVTYKAQFSEMSVMKTEVAGLQQAGQTLDGVSAAMDNQSIKTQLQSFAEQYNAWIARFDGTVKGNGLLAGTQAAEISLYELDQSVKNIFNGAKDGFHGMRDLGLSIDPNSRLATLDASQLDAALASNKSGAINAIHEFGANFARSAELLNSANNFIPNRLGNLDRVIHYIDSNKSSLQAEFGLGDPARLSPQVAKALAAYNQILKT
ncbi:MAG: flagellar filament capping protein FliD [Propionivibrio sp.]|uniref:flagellar filament capping protein FliD n=1 Tax=Propionivibrio sp. TaxID=2212460 RepID=UPI0025D0727F|nr:flagellar filament capping protein FliD [Propionivibrio sp.]MBK7355945.1 flagellar filament capping protein FliD [Propionivibrio sp.]MBK8400397.1 flagellar filament capping protein FliD [Propionivibrio sp.]MBK8895364.1 flagellar filament capping protein FliD [Propionivibrio sp.]MBL0208717.1 flagellar filament capping protein FliD [Propionivibrio sp.]